MKAALDKSKSDCAAGTDPAAIRETLRAALDAAKTKLRSDLQAVEKLGDATKALIETRRAAHDKAMADFKIALDKAKADLRVAFPKDAPTATAPQP